MRALLVLLLAVTCIPAPNERAGFCSGHCKGKGYQGSRFFLPLLACECWDREDLEAIYCDQPLPTLKRAGKGERPTVIYSSD